MSDTTRTAAHRQALRFADALTEGFHGCSSAAVYDINGTIYVVTSGTGEGQDYAYEIPSSEDLDALESAIAAGTWDYSSWCASDSPDYTTDLDDAIAYYLVTGCTLGDGGSSIVVDETMIRASDARRNVDCCHELGGIS